MPRTSWTSITLLTLLATLFVLPTCAHATGYTVTRLDDPTPDGCAVGDCSLREALDAANASGTDDEIDVPADTVQLSTSALVINPTSTSGELVIAGAGSAPDAITTTIDQTTPGARVFQVWGPSAVTFRRVAITGGTITAGSDGGGCVSAVQVPLTFDQVRMHHCDTDYGAGSPGGGGLNFNGGSSTTRYPVTFVDSSVDNNRAGQALSAQGGGIAATGNVALALVRTGVTDNFTWGQGGGIALYDPSNQAGDDAQLSLDSSTIANNHGDSGAAGVLVNNNNQSVPISVEIRSSTIAYNSTDSSIGGIGVYGMSSGITVQIGSSIIAMNASSNGTNASDSQCEFYGSGSSVTGTGNVTTAAADRCVPSTSNQVGTDPKLTASTKQLHGGPANSGGYGLQATSPAVDAGTPATCTAVGNDQRGATRDFNGSCDAGVIESGAIRSSTITATASPTSVGAGGGLVPTSTVTLELVNDINDTLRSAITAYLDLPGGTSLASALPGECVLAGSSVQCTPSAPVEPGATASWSIVVQAATSGTKTFPLSVGAVTSNANSTGDLGSVAILAVAAPSNSVLPSISGTRSVGSTLTCASGTWTNDPSYTYAWSRNGTTIAGQSAAMYATTGDDADADVTCTVTATNVRSAVSATSAALTVRPQPSATVRPAITGATVVGGTLTCSTGTWTGAGLTFAYQWLRGDAPIASATASTYLVAAADAGASLVCTVTAANDLLQGTATSTAARIEGSPVSTVAPAVHGKPAFGRALTCTTGTWTGTSPSFAYQWLRGGTSIRGATRATYVVKLADAKARISCQVTATTASGIASALSAAVTGPTNPHKCTIIGTSGRVALRGTPKRDVICGLGGNDVIDGRGGNDVIYGGPGNDRITGGTGKDVLYGEAGNDVLVAKDRTRDVVDGGTGRDVATVDRTGTSARRDVARRVERVR